MGNGADFFSLTETIASVTQLPEKRAIVGGTLWTMVMDDKQ